MNALQRLTELERIDIHAIDAARERDRPETWLSRLIENSMPEPNSGCWLWLGKLNGHGYGMMCGWINGKKYGVRAHRVSFEVFRGISPGRLHVCHRCDLPCCVNPGHLFLGTQADNIHDMWRKGRASPPPH